MASKALLGIVLFPLLGAIANGLFARGQNGDWQAGRKTVHWVACLSVAMSFVLALICFGQLVIARQAQPEANPALAYTAYEWFSIAFGGNRVPVQVRFVMDALSGVMTLFVTGIALLIHIYSTGYMSEEKSFARFFAYLNLFTASMLILVLGSNLPLMFVGWEGVGLCSYLLIGFWWENPAYAAAGRKAFIANRIGDFGVIVGMFLLVAAAHSFEFADINAQSALLTGAISLPGGFSLGAVSVATVATLFLFLGCTGKSAQIPLYVWLPDAMAGPTPVSALIHAATMVTSGLYLICRLSPVFAVAPTTLAVIAVIGATTALLAATIGCVQNDIKKVLAYSTVSQLGFMFAAAGCGAFAASFFHVFTHAFFKACLFLGAGSVMHAVGAHGDADIRRLGGLRKYLPRTHWTFLVSCLAIAGVPGFSGFFSKDEILSGALNSHEYVPAAVGYAVFAMLVLAATMTAFYMFRLYFMTFAGEYRGGPEHHEYHGHEDHADEHPHDPHESPAAMTIPLVVLGTGAVIAGYLWVGVLGLAHIHWEPWVDWLSPALAEVAEGEHAASAIVMALLSGTAAAAIGIGLAYSWYAKPDVAAPRIWAERFPKLHALAFDKWRVDELYDATILAGSRGLGVLSANIDKVVVDGLLTRVTSALVQGLGFVFTRVQNGLVQVYAAVMVAGLLVVTWWFTMPHARIVIPTPPDGDAVEFTAGAGLGYQYRWDFDSNAEFDTNWSSDVKASHTYVDGELQPGAVVALESAVYGAGVAQTRLKLGEKLTLAPRDLGPGWELDSNNDTPPMLEATKEGLVVRVNGARVRRGGKSVTEEKFVLARGEHITIGQARLTAAGWARATLYVRNAFGVERRTSSKMVLPEVGERRTLEMVGAAEARP